jgi:hypothetical protein
MDADILIVGAGIMGQRLRVEARKQGLTALIVANPARAAASACAVGVIATGSNFMGPDERALTARSVQIYRQEGFLFAEGATRLRRNGQEQQSHRHYGVDVRALLSEPADIGRAVTSVAPYRVSTLDHDYTARLAVFVAAGTGSERLGYPYELARTFGATAITDDAGPDGLRIFMTSPYQGVNFLRHNGEARIGSSSCTTGLMDAGSVLARTLSHCPPDFNPQDSELALGVRVHAPEAERVFIASEGLTFIAGLGRVGFSIAPALAERLIVGTSRNPIRYQNGSMAKTH